MSFKDIVFYAICTVTWFILLPALVVGGALTLVATACSEVREIFFGPAAASPDTTTARELARRLCLLP